MHSLEGLINALTVGTNVDALDQLISFSFNHEFTPLEVYKLAEKLSTSGKSLEWEDGVTVCDIASTGGPSSLSTLLCPLFLASRGMLVPKLGVPGRPAGGIDILAQIPGYRISLSEQEIQRTVGSCGYSHFLAGKNFAPLDAVLFRRRQELGAQNIPALAAASLLSKKLACGITSVGLDVRVAPFGNFGKCFDEARLASKLFCAAAKIGNIDAICFLSDARFPYQPYIGRGEALLALHGIINGKSMGSLKEHEEYCLAMADQVATSNGKLQLTSETKIRKVVEENIIEQGGLVEAFEEKVSAVKNSHTFYIVARQEGYMAVDLALIRRVFVKVNQPTQPNTITFPDEVGVILTADCGAPVKVNEKLASVRAKPSVWKAISDDFHRAIFSCEKQSDSTRKVETIHG